MILVNRVFSKEKMKHYEGAYTIGNGYMHVRASFDFDIAYATQDDRYWRLPANVTIEEAKHPYSKWGTYIPGIVGNHPLLNEEMVNLPYACGVNLYINNVKFDFETATIHNFVQELHMDCGTYSYAFDIETKDGNVHMQSMRYAHMYQKHILVQQIDVQADKNIQVRLESFMDCDVTTNGYSHFQDTKQWFENDHMWVDVTTDAKNRVVMLQDNQFSGQVVEKCSVKNRIVMRAEAMGTIHLKKVTAIATSLEQGDIRANAQESLDEYCLGSDMYTKHLHTWNDLWELHRIQIEGDAYVQEAIDFSIYHLIRSKAESNKVAIDAKGAAGEAYFGHYFWDTELYLLPFYVYSQPSKAKDLLMFRVHTCNAAIENARQYGYKGAKYPWESSISGLEQCPNWQYKDHEIHVSFDIVYAMQAYYKVTKDKDSCIHDFFPVVKEVALFALSRAYKDNLGAMHLKGVMGPDEYIMFCDDNYYTNFMAKFAVETYVSWCDAFHQPIAEEEKGQCVYFIEHIHLPMDETNNRLLQCENFYEFEDINFRKVWKDKTKPFGAQISQEQNYRSKALKQADTLLLFYLFENQWSVEELRAHLDYYLPLTTHDSSLSYVVHSILLAHTHEVDDAYEYLLHACAIDMEDGAAEGIHIANAGGLWQAIVYGFAGMKSWMWEDSMLFEPKLPKHWTKLSFQVSRFGSIYTIEISQKQVCIREKGSDHDGYHKKHAQGESLN